MIVASGVQISSTTRCVIPAAACVSMATPTNQAHCVKKVSNKKCRNYSLCLDDAVMLSVWKAKKQW